MLSGIKIVHKIAGYEYTVISLTDALCSAFEAVGVE